MQNKKTPKVDGEGNGTEVQSRPAEPEESQVLSAEEVAEFVVDLWKLGERVKADVASERVAAAYERAEERLKRIGFEIDPMVGRSYDTNIKAKVVDHEAEDGPLVVNQCISPAVYFRGRLVREAEIVTTGRGD